MSDTRIIRISIRDFALPVPRLGSIEAHSGYGRALEGAEIHLAVQARRAEIDATYRAEVPLSRTFKQGDYEFVVGGRMDGLYLPEVGAPRIEEIKSTFSVPDLKRKLEERGFAHPYNLQLLTYGYFYRLEHGVDPELTFHLVSTRGQGSDDLEILLDVDAYERWLAQRLAELAAEVAHAERRAVRRRKLARKFPFPFETPRAGQRELIATIESGMLEKKRMLI